jgi:hypothetical protein
MLSNVPNILSALKLTSSQLWDSCLEKKSRTTRLEIWVFKIVSFIALLSELIVHTSPERLALKWVQTYISEFGGDPKKVTM